MDRPNIRLSVLSTPGIAKKLATLEHLLQTLQGTGLIYCATRENTELVADYIAMRGIKIIAYHAGLDAKQKRQIQQAFVDDQYTVIAATNALGMGIDKANLRFIIHFDFPGSITAYYQETGRCGRDGLPAEGILLYDAADSKIQQYFIDSAQPAPADFQNVLQAIATSTLSLNLNAIKTLTGMHPTRLTVIVTELVEQQFLRKVSQNGLQVYRIIPNSNTPDLTRYSNQLAAKNNELAAIKNYAEQSSQCLMLILRTALGDLKATACGQCSVCADKGFKLVVDTQQIPAAVAWLNKRVVPVTLDQRIKHTLPGIAVLDGKFHTASFVHFMRQRAISLQIEHNISEDLMRLMKDSLQNLLKHHTFSCIVPVPSRTWLARDVVVSWLASYLRIPALLNLLSWQQYPLARQGELLNNDQRRHNVAKQMHAQNKIPAGTILLFDDYTGSGATLNEAARVLSQHAGIKNKILPFTIAAIKWRLGKRGMV